MKEPMSTKQTKEVERPIIDRRKDLEDEYNSNMHPFSGDLADFAIAKIQFLKDELTESKRELREGIEKRLIAFSDWTMENEDSPNYVTLQDVKDYLSNF